MGPSKAGIWIAGTCAAVMVLCIGYGMGRRAALWSMGPAARVTPAGAPLPTIRIEPIRPQEELAAIGATAQPQGLATASQMASDSSVEESSRIREIQLALRNAGFDPGPVDGRSGPRTKTAVRLFQVAHGLEADGKVGPRTWGELESFLKKDSSN